MSGGLRQATLEGRTSTTAVLNEYSAMILRSSVGPRLFDPSLAE